MSGAPLLRCSVELDRGRLPAMGMYAMSLVVVEGSPSVVALREATVVRVVQYVLPPGS